MGIDGIEDRASNRRRTSDGKYWYIKAWSADGLEKIDEETVMMLVSWGIDTAVMFR